MRDAPTNSDDVIDIRDVIARVEELREAEAKDEADTDELKRLEALLDECEGNGGDEQWEGNWYPVTLIRDDYFESYAQELAEDCGMITKDAKWPNNHIDWEAAADELKQDYTSVSFDGVDYWCR